MGRKSRAKKEERRAEKKKDERPAASSRGRLGPQNLAIVLGLAVLAGAFFYFFAQRSSNNLLRLEDILRNVSHVHALVVAGSTSSGPSRLILGTHDGMFISEDEGKTWRTAPGPMGQEDVMQFAGSPDGASFYAGGHNIAVMTSKDGGSTWVPARGNLPGTDVHNLAAYPGNRSTAYAFVVGHGLFRTRDGGGTWELMNRMQGQGIGALVVSQASPDTLYATTGEGIQVSTDGGRTWQPFRNELMGRRPFHLMEVAGSPGVLLAGTADGLWRSEDGGRSFRQESASVVRGAVLALAQHPGGPAYAITQEGALFKSPKGGKGWVRLHQE